MKPPCEPFAQNKLGNSPVIPARLSSSASLLRAQIWVPLSLFQHSLVMNCSVPRIPSRHHGHMPMLQGDSSSGTQYIPGTQ